MQSEMGTIALKEQSLARVLEALKDGLYLVDAKGEILCIVQDVTHRQRPSRKLIAAIEAVVADTSAIGRSLLEKLSGRTDKGDGLSLLTERERDVLGLICQGQDDDEMSAALGLSRNTVRNHVAALYRKIGVNRRSAAILWAQERGIASEGLPVPRPSLRARLTGERAGDPAHLY